MVINSLEWKGSVKAKYNLARACPITLISRIPQGTGSLNKGTTIARPLSVKGKPSLQCTNYPRAKGEPTLTARGHISYHGQPCHNTYLVANKVIFVTSCGGVETVQRLSKEMPLWDYSGNGLNAFGHVRHTASSPYHRAKN